MDNANPQSTLETILDGVQIDITHSDGTTENIRVRKVPIRDLARLGQAWGKEPLEVAVYADKPAAWVNTLTEASFEAIMEEGRRLNFPSFKKYFVRQAQMLEAIGQNTQLNQLLEKVVTELATSELKSRSSS